MTQTSIGDQRLPYPPDEQPQVGDIYHLPTGVKVSKQQMLDMISAYRVVFVGETHDNPASHRLELEVLTAMAERHPGQISLGLEMFTTEQQEVLDLWVAGTLTEKEFLKQSGWHSGWKMDFALYRDILLYARDQKIPVIGLNSPRELVKAIGQTPIDQLEPEQQARLPEMDLDDPYQRAMTEAVFADHKAGKHMVDGFHRAQTLWDESMAESVAQHLEQAGPEQRMVVMAGGNHVRYGFGIPRRVYRRMPVSYVLVGSKEIEIPEEKQNRMMDIDLPSFPMPAYDYQAYTAYESLPGKKVKLGVRMNDEEGKVIVKEVIADSTAAAAGVEEGDILLALDETTIEENFDLVYEISQKQEGDSAVLVVERSGERLKLDVVFKPLSMSGMHGKHSAKP
jgi:uncharacterized iron-regulated protein